MSRYDPNPTYKHSTSTCSVDIYIKIKKPTKPWHSLTSLYHKGKIIREIWLKFCYKLLK